MKEIWYLGIATVFLQAVVSVLLLHREFLRKLALEGGLLSRAPVVTLE